MHLFTQSSLTSAAYGVFTLPCGCRMHRGCLQHVLKSDLTCQCAKVTQELIKRDKEGISVDFGKSSLLQTKALYHLMAKACITNDPEPSGVQKAPRPTVAALPSPQKSAVVPRKGKLEITKKNTKTLLANHVPMEEMQSAGISMGDIRQENITVDLLSSAYGYRIEEYAKYLQPENKWAQLLAMGLNWTHLKNKALFSPIFLAREIMPTTEEFLSLFIDPKELQDAYSPVEETDNLLIHHAIIEKTEKRVLPLERLLEINYTPIELVAFGVSGDHLINILGASVEEVKNLYKSMESGAELIIGPPPAERPKTIY